MAGLEQQETNDSAIEETVVDTLAEGEGERGPGLARGELVGRYVILSRVGAGGMGVVYAAYDPELDRKVALKRMHADRSRPDSLSDGRSRLLREAQAMARLSHPNVVAVHDVGVHDDRVFLAMEFVEGQTLYDYLKQELHPWPEVVKIFCAAGRGLAAAHEAGLVHRDFKPENVLMHKGGGVKVTDFGLAREGDREGGERVTMSATLKEASDSLGAGIIDATGPSLTRTGAVLGTPAYMAPEQHAGLPCEPRTDQFSFCVALYEALYGKRPFEASGRAALAIAVAEGEVAEAPPGTKVPGWLREVVLRGLDPDPGARHPSMLELIAALESDPTARRRPWLVAAGVGAVALAAGLGVVISGSSEEPALCTSAGDHLEGVWDDAARGRLHAAFESSGVGFAESTFERTSAELDAYTAAWVAMRREACEATQLHGEQSQALMDLRMECLDARLESLESLVVVLSEADATVTQNAVAAASNLPGLDRCADAASLRAAVPPPDAAGVAAVAEVRRVLSQARAHGAAGKYEAGLALARTAVEQARTSNYDPVLVEALYRRGVLEHETGSLDEAEQTLEAAYFLAVRNDLDDSSARAATRLVDLLGKAKAQPARGRDWAAHARAQADSSGEPLLRAAAIHALAGVAHTESAFDEAQSLATQARELRTAELGPRHEVQLASLNQLGLIALDTGKHDVATDYMQQGLELGREILGPDHPDLARFLNNLAKIAWMQGKFDEAGRSFEQALELQSDALGPSHPNVAQLHNNLAAVAVSNGDMDEASRRFELALEIWEQALGSDHPSVADGLNNLAVVASARGRYQEAREYDERALAIRERTMEAGHPAIAQNYNNLGEDLMHLGDVQGALELHEKALEMWEAKLGPEHDDVAVALTAIGNDLVLLGRAAEALPKLERARQIREPLEIDEVERAHTHWTLARALWDAPPSAGRDRARARTLAKRALDAYEAGGEETEAPKVEAWLAARG